MWIHDFWEEKLDMVSAITIIAKIYTKILLYIIYAWVHRQTQQAHDVGITAKFSLEQRNKV